MRRSRWVHPDRMGLVQLRNVPGMLGDVHAPGFVDVEVTQTLRGLLRGAKVDLATAARRRDDERALDRRA